MYNFKPTNNHQFKSWTHKMFTPYRFTVALHFHPTFVGDAGRADADVPTGAAAFGAFAAAVSAGGAGGGGGGAAAAAGCAAAGGGGGGGGGGLFTLSHLSFIIGSF